MDNLLITGCTGFLGSYLNTFLSDKYNCKGLSTKTADITDYASLSDIDFFPETIIHTAAKITGSIEELFLVNELGTLNVCKLAKEKGCKHIILISSISVYDKAENDYYNSYAVTKSNAEKIALKFCEKESIKLTILRFSQVYDYAGVAKKNQQMLYSFISNIMNKQEINIYGTKNPIRNYLDIDYCVNVIFDSILQNRNGIYNICHPVSHTLTDIAYMIFDILEIKPKINFLKDKSDISSIYIPKDNVYKSTYQPLYLKDGLQRIINFEQ